MQSTGSEYLSTGPVEVSLPRRRKKSAAEVLEERRLLELRRVVFKDIPIVLAGNQGRCDAPWIRTDLTKYVENL